MRITVTDDDIMMLYIREGKIARTAQRGEILVDLDESGRVVSIEVLGASLTPARDLMAVFTEFGLDKALISAA